MGRDDEQNSSYGEKASCDDESKPMPLASTKGNNL
jgi:hypothetical protein